MLQSSKIVEGQMQERETEFNRIELIHYYWQLLNLIKDPHMKANPNIEIDPELKGHTEVILDPLKYYAFDYAVSLHRNNFKPLPLPPKQKDI